ncbi:hypothetical protein V0288_04385 [Pannus brasiliensis CCIBt3594]|uniref:Uncharacterized protein n=1 Tax=Pannus brasiliensis CCIBt3594 TaxID=1427578 RepID=A0AAW9QUR4_9CHRO
MQILKFGSGSQEAGGRRQESGGRRQEAGGIEFSNPAIVILYCTLPKIFRELLVSLPLE